MNTETYQGWANRETWAFNLHWQNDQGLYDAVREHAAEQIEASVKYGEHSDSGLGQSTIDYVEELLEESRPHNEQAYRVIREIGSWWRIDRAEVGAAVREAVDHG